MGCNRVQIGTSRLRYRSRPVRSFAVSGGARSPNYKNAYQRHLLARRFWRFALWGCCEPQGFPCGASRRTNQSRRQTSGEQNPPLDVRCRIPENASAPRICKFAPVPSGDAVDLMRGYVVLFLPTADHIATLQEPAADQNRALPFRSGAHVLQQDTRSAGTPGVRCVPGVADFLQRRSRAVEPLLSRQSRAAR